MPSVAQSAASGGNVSGLDAIFPNNLMSGSLILAFVGAGAASINSVTDSQSNTYTQQILKSGWGVNSNENLAIYSATAKSGANTVTLAVSAASNTGIIVMEISGVTAAGASTYYSNNGGSGTTAKLGAAQNYNANQVLIASDRNERGTIATIAAGWTATSGFIIGPNDNAGVNQYQVPGAGGSTDAAFGANDPGAWGICVAFLAQPTVGTFYPSSSKKFAFRRNRR